MALIIQNSNYNGEVLNRLLTKAITGCQIVDKGLICVIPAVKDKVAIPRLKVKKMLRKPNPNPQVTDSKGDFIYSEHQLEPEEMLVFTVFNPDTFDHIWRPYQPTGNLVFYELPPNVQNELLDAMSKQVQFELGWHFINGEYNSNPADDEHLMNGILYRLKNDSDVIRIASTAETMTGKLYAIRSSIPVAMKELPELRYIMSPADWEQYDEELTSREHKNSDETDLNKKSFKGVPIETLVGWPDGLIMATLCSPHETTSNLFAAVNLVNDDKVIQIDKVSAASDLYFFKMKMRADTNDAFGEEVVILDTRDDKEFPVLEKAISTDVNTVSFGSTGGTKFVTVTAPGDFSVSRTSGKYIVEVKDGRLVITAAANEGEEDITETVTLTLDSDDTVTKTITLTTSAAEAAQTPTIEGDDSLTVPATPGSNVRTYATSNGAGVTAESDSQWLTVAASGNKVTFTRQAYAYDAEGEATRVATVTVGIEGTEVTKTVTVTQAMAANA